MQSGMDERGGVTIADALNNITSMNDIPIVDDQMCIEALAQNFECRANFDTNFEDRNAFITGCSKYIEEATRHATFTKMLHEGFDHAATIYTWRCCSRAITMPKSNDQPNRAEINNKVAEVLSPEVHKLELLMDFTILAIKRFCEELKRLCHPEKRRDFVSETYLLILGKFLNMFAVLDELKIMNSSIKNDFSTYKRSASQSLNNTPTSKFQQMQNLSMFLATHNNIKQMLLQELQKISGYEELLADIVNICMVFSEEKRYIYPEDRHMYVKVMAVCLYLMDAEESNVERLDQKKRIHIAKLDKIFKSIEVVPLFGDMQIQPFSFVKRSGFYDASKWPLSSVTSEHCQVNIVQKLRTIREHHDGYVTHLARIKNESSVYDKDGPRSDAENKEIVNVTLSGLKLLCAWTSDVMETISWKLLHPTNTRDNPECPEDAESYARATKYNYSAAEKVALIEIIAMIKGVQQLIGNMESDFSIAIRRHVYAELQDFVQITIHEPLSKAIKHKKDLLTGIMNSIIDTCSDSSAADHLGKYGSRSSDISVKSTKKSKKGNSCASLSDLRMKRRNVAPSSTQLYMARTLLESLISEKSAQGKRVYRKDIDQKHLDRMTDFLRSSYNWPALLQLPTALEQSADLSQLWFREFYLEMTMGQRIQFPIDMSLPWILIDHILTTQDPALLECVLYQFDLYNDAANYSLKKFRKRFLYDELEAEVNLCFDQFLFKLSEAIFTHYKQLAAWWVIGQFFTGQFDGIKQMAWLKSIGVVGQLGYSRRKQEIFSMLLDKGFKSECARLGITIRSPPASRYDILLKQRHFLLLGRTIDLNRLMCQRVSASILRSLDIALSKFESEGLHYIMALNNLLDTNRLCHRLLREHLTALADFQSLFDEANHQVSTTNGRITQHTFNELTKDLIPNHAFNTTTRRFVRGRVNYRNPPNRAKARAVAFPYEFGSKSLNAAFSNLSMMYGSFVGTPHLRVIAKLLGYQGIAAVVDELLRQMTNLINDQLKNRVRVLYDLAPKVCKLLRYDYGADGTFQYFFHHMKDLLSYAPLRREVCQCFRELGNTLIFCHQLELALAQEEMFDLLSAAAFTGVIPKPPAKTLEEQNAKMKRLENKYARIQIASVVQQFGTENQAQNARENELLTKERLCCGLNIFEMVLSRLRDCLREDTIWTGGDPPNGVMWVDECVEFHRLWSCIQFALCYLHVEHSLTPCPTGEGGSSAGIEEVFGDGIYWAGCTLIRLLGQHRRFEVLDFSYHLLRVHRTNPTAKVKDDGKGAVSNVPLISLVDRIRRLQAGNNQLFAIIGSFTQSWEEAESCYVREYLPPIYQPKQSNDNGATDAEFVENQYSM